MPQFDIFCFFSQLFWTFLFFFLFFLSFSYYLLPAISIILKVRKRKLSLLNSPEKNIAQNNLLSVNNFLSRISATFLSTAAISNKNTISSDNLGSITILHFKTRAVNYLQMFLLCGLFFLILLKITSKKFFK